MGLLFIAAFSFDRSLLFLFLLPVREVFLPFTLLRLLFMSLLFNEKLTVGGLKFCEEFSSFENGGE
jgi:hypothetical protein